ncbi:MAG: hypothetical protein ACRDGE_11645, partial [Candidatus Limnocylindria bacterium]
TGLMKALMPLLPPLPPGAPGPFALGDEEVLRKVVSEAGLAETSRGDVTYAWEWLDLDSALRAVLSAGPAVLAARVSGEASVSEAAAEFLAGHRTDGGAYRLANTFRYLICTA